MFRTTRREAVTKIDQLSLKDRIEELNPTPTERALLLAWWEGVACAPADTVGYVSVLKWIACAAWDNTVMVDATSRYKIKKGTGSLIGHMLEDSGATVRLSCPVSKVTDTRNSPVRRSFGDRWILSPVTPVQHSLSLGLQVEATKDGVEITADDGERVVKAKAAIVTVPFNVLHDLTFSPPLAGLKQEASEERQATVGFQVMIRLHGLPPQGPFYSMSDTPEGIQWLAMEGTTEDGDAILVAYGPDSRRFDIHDRKAVHEEVHSKSSCLPRGGCLTLLSRHFHADSRHFNADLHAAFNANRCGGSVLVLWWRRRSVGTG